MLNILLVIILTGGPRPVTALNETLQGELDGILHELSASDWRARSKGLTDMESFIAGNTRAVSGKALAIYSSLAARLADNNKKVCFLFSVMF